MTTVEERLAALGITLPQPVAPVANYAPFVRSGSLAHISGQISIDAEGGVKGVVGQDIDLERAIAAARVSPSHPSPVPIRPARFILPPGKDEHTGPLVRSSDGDFAIAAARLHHMRAAVAARDPYGDVAVVGLGAEARALAQGLPAAGPDPWRPAG